MIENEKDFPAFKAMIISNFARLNDVLTRHTARLYSSHRELVTRRTLELAYGERHRFDPSKQSITQWWSSCIVRVQNTKYKVSKPRYKLSDVSQWFVYLKEDNKHKSTEQLMREARNSRSLFED